MTAFDGTPALVSKTVYQLPYNPILYDADSCASGMASGPYPISALGGAEAYCDMEFDNGG